MPQAINYKGELLRIAPREIESSINRGLSWSTRCYSNNIDGEFVDLLEFGNELIAITSKRGIMASWTDSRTWSLRAHTIPQYGEFQTLSTDGSMLIAVTSKAGMCFSRDAGRTWSRRP